jgi:5-methylcytosine-specific restriction protein B
VSQQDKVNIVNAFSSLIDNRSESVDDKLLKIRGELKKYVDKNSGYKNAEFTFYDDGIKEMWNFSPDESISDIDSMPPIESFLDYKKALILYGPPGTGKTYSAETIAKRMFSLSYLKNKDESKGTLKDF